ncbi:thymidine phosphorylase [Pricia antarctica]|uniref:Thymidine phosphorylase n=1 Tax=Pricia antarctica TaxID=641691 RepID=A0A1G7HQ05_9FLAO|nr:hypothetical protein [Pricia antarctica]SDF02525.1 thymidine phosphorylase [Pricia antarctica]
MRSKETAEKLKEHIEVVGEKIGLKTSVVITDGTQPVGNGIGPVLEAIEVLHILRGDTKAPVDLKERALLLAGRLLIFSGKVAEGNGNETARELLESGKVYKKFMAICKAQGRFTESKIAAYSDKVRSENKDTLVRIDDRKIAKLAKLSGAPEFKAAGILLNVHLGETLKKGHLLYTVYAEAEGELIYAMDYLKAHKDVMTII